MYENYDEFVMPSALMTLISLAMVVFSVVIVWRIFVKAGEHGWASLIPFYNFDFLIYLLVFYSLLIIVSIRR